MAKKQPTQASVGVKNTRTGPKPKVFVSLGNLAKTGGNNPSHSLCRKTTADHFGLDGKNFVEGKNKKGKTFIYPGAKSDDLILVDPKGARFTISVPKYMTVKEMVNWAEKIKTNAPKKIITPGGFEIDLDTAAATP